jgi:hypothetical protein
MHAISPSPHMRPCAASLETRFEDVGFRLFQGDLDIMGQIDMPLLDWLNMTFFNQLTFDTPHFRDFSSCIEMFETPCKAEIYIYGFGVGVKAFSARWERLSPYIIVGPLMQTIGSAAFVSCRSLVQVFTLGLSHILTLECLEIVGSRGHWKDNTDNAQWLEVLHPFTSVKSLVLGWGLLDVIAPTLEDLAGESVTEVLPALKNLFLQFQQPLERNLSRKRLGSSFLHVGSRAAL